MDLRYFRIGVLPFIVATAGEFAGLFFWLQFWDRGYWLLAVLILGAGFLTERLAVLWWVDKNFGSAVGIASIEKPAWQRLLGLVAICLSEISIWVVFVFVYDSFGILAGFVALLVGEQVEHSVELGLLKGQPWAKFLTYSTTFVITTLEVLGGIGWLYFVRAGDPLLGGACLLLGLTVEHVVQGGAITPRHWTPPTAAA